MGEIRVSASDVGSAGDRIQALAPSASALQGVAASAASAATDPPATAAALEHCASAWNGALGSLTDELLSLGGAVQAAAVLYTTTDQGAMGGGG